MRDLFGRTGPRPASSARPALERLEGRELPAPLTPTGLVATGISASAIALTWDASADRSVTGYDVYERVWIRGVHGPKGGGGTPGHYVYRRIATDLTATADTVAGLKPGSTHDYVVTAVGPSGESAHSADAAAETWVAPSFSNGPNVVLLSSGALWSGAVDATAGLTTQLSLLVAGNPLRFSVVSGPRTVSIDPYSGVVTYTPAAKEVGTVDVTLRASNPLGAVTQTIRFHVAARNPRLLTPALRLDASTSTYDGRYQPVSATAVGKDGVTRIGGTFAIAYHGGKGGYPLNVGTYPVLVTFTSGDPRYGDATLLTTFTITKASPVFSGLAAPTIAVGTATTTLSGHLAAGAAVPAGDRVIVTLGGVSQDAAVDANGDFAATFATGTLPVGRDKVTYAFAGDRDFKAAPDGTSTIAVVPTAPPRVTLTPADQSVTAGDGVAFTAAATGSPAPGVQWQVSTDGGKTFTDITGNASASTTTLVLTLTTASQDGDEYRAVFTNAVGRATTSAATLTVTTDTAGGGG